MNRGNPSTGGPLKPGFGLSGDVQISPNSVIPTGVEGPAVVTSPGGEGRVEIESEWTARKREPAAGKFCPVVELPHSSQKQA